MKVEINTEEKTIALGEMVKISELLEFIHKFDLKEYTIIPYRSFNSFNPPTTYPTTFPNPPFNPGLGTITYSHKTN